MSRGSGEVSVSQLRAPCLRCGLSANLCCKAWSHEAQTHRPNPWRVMSRIGKHMVRGSELRSLMTWTFYERDRWVCHGVLRASTSCASNAGKRAGRRCYIVLCFCRLVARRVLAACRWRTPDEATAIAGAGPLFAPFTLSTEIGLAGVDVSHAPKRASFQISGQLSPPHHQSLLPQPLHPLSKSFRPPPPHSSAMHLNGWENSQLRSAAP